MDIQIPGFQWLHSVSIEDEGRKFIDLIPRSLAVQSKVDADWRLRNGLQLLAHVQSLHGGRRLSLRSPFEVVNKTDHPILLSLSPDPRHAPQSNENAESASETHNFELEELHPGMPHVLHDCWLWCSRAKLPKLHASAAQYALTVTLPMPQLDPAICFWRKSPMRRETQTNLLFLIRRMCRIYR